MSTHASHTHDVIERLEKMRDRIDELRAEESKRQGVLHAELNEAERELLLADCFQLFRQLPTRNFSESQRLRVHGVLGRLKDQLGRKQA
jgi:hypothetical protein